MTANQYIDPLPPIGPTPPAPTPAPTPTPTPTSTGHGAPYRDLLPATGSDDALPDVAMLGLALLLAGVGLAVMAKQKVGAWFRRMLP